MYRQYYRQNKTKWNSLSFLNYFQITSPFGLFRKWLLWTNPTQRKVSQYLVLKIVSKYICHITFIYSVKAILFYSFCFSLYRKKLSVTYWYLKEYDSAIFLSKDMARWLLLLIWQMHVTLFKLSNIFT